MPAASTGIASVFTLAQRGAEMRRIRLGVLGVLGLLSSACSSALPGARTLRSPVHAVLMADVHDARVHTALGSVVEPEVSAPLLSLDGSVLRLQGIGPGVAGRVVAGGSGAPALVQLGALFGSKQIALEAGVGSRTALDPDDARKGYRSTYPMGYLGLRSRVSLGASPFSVHFRGARYLATSSEEDSNLGAAAPEGWNAETGVSWTSRSIPFSLNLGYRIERFRHFTTEQEVSSLAVGAGLILGRR